MRIYQRGVHTVFAFGVQMVGVASGYLLHVALARWMGPAQYGSYAYAMAWIGLCSMATALGLPVSSVRFLSEYRARHQAGLLRGTVRRFRQLVIAAGTAVAVAGMIAGLIVRRWPSWIAIAAWVVPLMSFVSLNTEMARGLERPTLSQVPDKIVRPLLTVLGAGLLVTAGTLTVGAAMTAGLAALAVVALLQTVLIRPALATATAAAPAEYRTRDWMRVALSLLTVSFFVLLMGQIDLLVAGLFLDPAAIGIYSAAIRVASLIGFVPLSVTIVTSPQIAALYAQHDSRRLQSLASDIASLSFWPSLVLAAGVIAFAGPILRVFGPDFVAASGALRILAACQLFKSGMGAVGYLLDMTGHQDHNARTFVAGSVLALVLNLTAIPAFGILGAAVANLLSWVIVTLWLHREVNRLVGVRASIVSAIRLQRADRQAR